jgi:hypothetical protein
MEWIGLGLYEGSIIALSWIDWVKPRDTLFRIPAVRLSIEYLPHNLNVRPNKSWTTTFQSSSVISPNEVYAILAHLHFMD